MDPVKGEKLRAMKKYKRNKFLQNFFQYCLTAYVMLLCLYNAFPSLCLALKLFIFDPIPKLAASMIGPKCLFVICNAIVIFLLKESRLMSSSPPSPASDLYDEYMKHSRSVRRSPPSAAAAIREKGLEKRLEISPSEVDVNEDVKEEKTEEKENVEEEEEVVPEPPEDENIDGGDEDAEKEEKEEAVELCEEEGGLPADELKRRVEDFIARVNKQRRLEAELLICGG